MNHSLRKSQEVRGHTCADTCTQGTPASPPPCPGHTCALPSFTEMVGFFCRSPSRMKKRTSGMKISKARTHWKG
jgi:hypothetical protein